jgi:2',3'-cyclic-nucleotide 2'-phosphodiesterase (5'-nucleotidase family)
LKKLIYILFFTIIFGQETSKENFLDISIVSTSNVFSEYYDCGCPKNPLGGLARKTFFLKNMMPGRDSFLIDAGNALFDSNQINPDNLSLENKRFKARNFVKTLEFLGQDIVNIGSNDFKGGVDFLIDITKDSSVNFISANLYDKSSNKLLFKPYHVLEKNGAKIAFIGLSESARSNSMINKNYIEEGNRLISELKDKVDIIILLVDKKHNTNIRDVSLSFLALSNSFPDANYIFVSGSTKRTEPRTKQSDSGALVYGGGIQGMHLSILDIRIKAPNEAIIDVSAPFNRLQEIDYRLNRLKAKDPSIRLEELYANQPNVLSLIEKYQKEATELGISLAGYQNRSTFFSVPLSPTIPDDKDVAAFIQNIADKADFSLKN